FLFLCVTKALLGVLCAVFLLLDVTAGEGGDGKRDQECYNYAGGHVYPGEAFRVPVSDHSLHLSKAKISKPAPHWEGTAVINGEFKELKLSDYKGKYLVFFFYPLDFTFVCPTEIIAFSDRVHEFHAINADVVACSVDSQFTHLAWINTPRKQGGLGSMKIPLLSDLTHQIAKDYGVYLEDQGHTLRGLFIIDNKGTLRQITMNDLPVGRSVDETLRLVQAFQYTDKHGEAYGDVCIIPDPSGKLKYFDKLN
uniref:thioredoxin-dependent peroxiredoxin n=1 Tax=Pygocentrus nattereri TaxID=42514 RepID=A0A3B4CMT1_PYGNA